MRADGGAAPSGRAAAAEPPKASGCPVDHSKWSAWAGRSAAAAGGDGEADINPDNRMPVLSQQPAAGQDAVLDTSRVVSSIPQGRAGATERWVYPSEQQFYNALVRKGKDDGVDTAAMPSVIAIHNNMNEKGWAEAPLGRKSEDTHRHARGGARTGHARGTDAWLQTRGGT